MKTSFYTIILCASLFLLSCKGTADMDYTKAKTVCENCLKAIDAGNTESVINDYYSNELAAGSKDELNNKFSRLKETTGALVSCTLKDSSMSAEIGEEAKVVLTYEVKHSALTTTERFVVVEQAGSYRISNHSINN